MLLIDPAGEIARLDTGIGELETLAPTREAFEKTITDTDTLADWFLEPVVDELRQQGLRLGPGQCYGFEILESTVLRRRLAAAQCSTGLNRSNRYNSATTSPDAQQQNYFRNNAALGVISDCKRTVL